MAKGQLVQRAAWRTGGWCSVQAGERAASVLCSLASERAAGATRCLANERLVRCAGCGSCGWCGTRPTNERAAGATSRLSSELLVGHTDLRLAGAVCCRVSEPMVRCEGFGLCGWCGTGPTNERLE
jgi:hypothetical protein